MIGIRPSFRAAKAIASAQFVRDARKEGGGFEATAITRFLKAQPIRKNRQANLRSRMVKKFIVTLFALSASYGCSGLFASEPMGKQLERALKTIEEQCRAVGAPPFGPNKPGTFETACLMFALKPWEPGDTPESAFAHSIKLPIPHNMPKNIYKQGMSSEDYFIALCKEEAGEWVFRRVEGIKGIRQERPKLTLPLGYSGIVFFAAEQAHYMDSDLQDYFVAPPIGRYNFLEISKWPKSSSTDRRQYLRFSRGSGAAKMEKTETPDAEANFAFIWRGVRRPFDRENAIDGYEIIVYQVSPLEVLAFQRGFSYRYLDRNTRDLRIPAGAGCTGGLMTPPKFIESVLIPQSN